jgi:hypothetical protein
LRAARFFAHLLPGLLLFARPAKQKNILHGFSLQMLAYRPPALKAPAFQTWG